MSDGGVPAAAGGAIEEAAVSLAPPLKVDDHAPPPMLEDGGADEECTGEDSDDAGVSTGLGGKRWKRHGAKGEDAEQAGPMPPELTISPAEVKTIVMLVVSPLVDQDEDDEEMGKAVPEDLMAGSATTLRKSITPSNGRDVRQPSAIATADSASEKKDATGAAVEKDSENEARRRRRRQQLAARYGYDHNRSLQWTTSICDTIVERLIRLGKPYKFVVHSVVARKCGAGIHVCSSCWYGQRDGWLSHVHDLSQYVYIVVSVYWCAIA